MWLGAAVDEGDKLDLHEGGRVAMRTVRLLRPERRTVSAAIAWIVVSTLAALAVPTLIRYAIDNGLVPNDVAALNKAIVAFAFVIAIAFVASWRQTLAVARAGESFLRSLRVGVFAHLLALPLSFYDKERAGVLVSRMTSDIDSMAELLQFGLLQFVANGLLFVFTVILLVVLSWELTLVCLIPVPLVLIASRKFQRDSNVAYLTVRDRIGQNLSLMQEGITGVRVIQAFARQEATVARFGRSNRNLYDAHMESVRISVWYFPIIEFAGIATTGAVVGIGGWLVHQGRVSLGTVVAFVLLLANLFDPIQQLSQLFNTVQAAGAALRKLYGLLDTVPEIAERPGAVDLPERGDIAIDAVTFRYRGGPKVLDDVTLTVPAGERIAFVGPTGAGKSTLAKLVARFYDPVVGQVSFGGVNLSDATLRSLRERVVVVPQEGFLFAGTIVDNVRVGRPDASRAEVVAALDAIGVRERFEGLPDGLDTEVRERGSRLSAGERQLVSLARAALADPAVLILDEATSSLDPGTELAVEDAIGRLAQHRTLIAIAHRLTTAERSDRVVVVEGGGLAEVGSHDELVARGGHYARLYESWTSAGTLAS
jgi:ATP-binding cassette subfamily B protein